MSTNVARAATLIVPIRLACSADELLNHSELLGRFNKNARALPSAAEHLVLKIEDSKLKIDIETAVADFRSQSYEAGASPAARLAAAGW